jgi:phospholipid/cholesterol/gamma-HCH transport system substrate-binding protein
VKRDNINYLVAGATVLGAFALLFVVLFQITGRSGETDDYYTYYDDVAGLRFGTPVFYEGYRVGQVETVTPEFNGSQTRFRIDLTVEQGWPIPTDTVAAITTAGLLSDVFIVLEQGANKALLSPGSEIEGEEAADVFAALNDLAEEFQRLTESELGPLITMITGRADTITSELERGTPEVVRQLEEMISKLNQSASSVQQLLGQENLDYVKHSLGNLEQTSDSSRQLAEELRETRLELHALMKDVRGMVGDNRPDVDRTVKDLAAAVEDVSARLESIGYNLDEASRNLNEFARAIRMSPNRLIFSQEDDVVEEQP